MKSYLSRGISLTANMQATDQMDFYNGNSVIHLDCDFDEINHAVNIVGYGQKDGKDVWVVRNSWGQRWGANGYFYVEIGKNSFCLESVNFATIPKGFSPERGLCAHPGNHTRGNSWHLDPDNGEIV